MDPAIKYLPKKHDTKKLKQKRQERDNCELCEAPFSTKYAILNRNPVRHCKRCGKAICHVCSEGFRRLSQSDPEAYRVCDLCDFEMDNV